VRTLRLNEIEIWVVKVTGFTDEVDLDGNNTGEEIPQFGTPNKVRLSLYPNNGNITNQFMGKIIEADFIAVSTEIDLDENDLLFHEEPITDFDTTYDYNVTRKLPSLNGYQYWLEGRV